MALSSKQKLGKFFEEQARTFLETKGLIFLESNYNCYFGEIDLIMQDKEHIVFVEVRQRSYSDYGSALESINQPKMRRLIKTGSHYLQMKKWLYKVNSRFDVIAIGRLSGTFDIDWIKNAFTVDSW